MYQIWTLYDIPGLAKHYIVNKETKEVQSMWKKYLDAKQVCDTLNKTALKEAS